MPLARAYLKHQAALLEAGAGQVDVVTWKLTEQHTAALAAQLAALQERSAD